MSALMSEGFGELVRVAVECGALAVEARRREVLAAWDAEESRYTPVGEFAPGDRVMLRGRALWSMGLLAGELGGQRWTVVACQCELCQLGRHVAVAHRHVAKAALRHVGQPCVDELRAVDSDVQRSQVAGGLERSSQGRVLMPRLAGFSKTGRRAVTLPTLAAPPRARVLMADPPWSFGDSLPGNGRGAEKHYPCMSVQDIKRFALPPLADDCLLLMWRCSAMQVEALSVMQAWGFVPKSELVWIKLTRGKRVNGEPSKLHFGMGRYTRMAHEVCLIGVRGRVEVADHGVRSVFAAPVQEHSRKPDEVYAIAERLVPGGPFVELFGRRTRPGWTVLGNQVTT